MSAVAGDTDNWDVFSEVATSAPGAEAIGERFLSEMMAGGGVMSGVREGRSGGAESADDESDAESEYSLDGQKRLKHGQEVNAITAAALELRAKGSEWSSAIRANTYAALQRGRYAQAGPDRQPIDEQLIFKAPVVLNITELETAGGLYDRLKAGTVVASVVGPTGIGKSTKFSAKIAQKVGCRVLQISPDCVLKEDHGEQLSKLVTVSPFWSKSKRPMVSLMTPQEFCGKFFVDGWKDMVACFDVVVLDEAHIPSYWNNGVKAAVTSKCIGSVSLLMLTATMKGVEDLQSTAQRPQYMPKPIEEIVGDDDFMESTFAVDRSMFIVESNERLQSVASALSGVGCIVLTLESGSSRDAVKRVESALKGDSPAVRILVAHAKFGYGTNLPISRVVTTGLRQFVASDGNGGYMWKRMPLSAAEVKQHLGRADRGMVSSSGQGVVLLEQSMLAPQVDLLESEKFSFYVLLVAMGIRPSKKLRTTFESVLPHGLTRRVAVAILGVYGLPAEVVVRFLSEDGAFPHSYMRSLRQFSTVGSHTIVSEHKTPVGYEDWVEIDAFGILGKDFGPKIKVPFLAEGELMILLTFVCAAAQGLYVPEAAPMLQDDGYTSGPEREVRRVKKWAGLEYKPTPLEITAPPAEVVREDKRRKGFVLDVPLDQQPNYRRVGSIVFPQHVKDALGMVDYSPKIIEEVDAKERIFIRFADDLDIESPVEVSGKTKMFMLPKPVWRQLQKGEVLNEAAFKLLLSVIKKHFREFAASSAFANWGDPWISVLASFAEDEYVSIVKVKGVVPQVVSFLALLWQRYYAGMETAVRESHWSLNFWRKMVVKFKMSRNMAPRPDEGGTVDVAQSDAFKQRLYLIRLNFALVIEACERNSVFAHEAVTNLQNILPISQRLGHSVYDAVWDGNAVPSGMRRRPVSSEFERVSEHDYRVVELTDDFDSALGRLGSRFGSRSAGY